MKRYIPILILMMLFLSIQRSKAQLTTYLFEDFEALSDTTEDKTPPALPLGWSSSIENGNQDWRFRYGGFTTVTIRHPRTPKSGRRNALFQAQQDFWKAKLITPSMDLSTSTNPFLFYYVAQDAWFGNVDYLNIYYKKCSSCSWNLVKSLTTQKVNWVLDSFQLDNTWLSNDFFIAFEGLSNFGWGICLDSIVIKDTWTVPRSIQSVTVKQASTSNVPQGFKYAPILRIDFRVSGNTGGDTLKSITVNSSVTDVSNIVNNGVTLFYTRDSTFSPGNQLGSGQNFVGNSATFSGLNLNLPSGLSCVWVTYSIDSLATVEQLLAGRIVAGDITADNKAWPLQTFETPSNMRRKIAATIFHEDFENPAKSALWTLTNEFEINSPVVIAPVGMYGYPHPAAAFGGTKLLGTDLTGLGATPGFYEKSIGSNAYSAYSPTFNAKFYKNVNVMYERWLNVKDADSANFYAFDGTNWLKLWYSGMQLTTIADNSWKTIEHNLAAIDRKSNAKLWYSLGPTNNLAQMSGWTLDDIYITGTQVKYDMSATQVTSPTSTCGMTNSETVKAIFTNEGLLSLTGDIHVRYTVNGLNPVDDTLTLGTLL
jgi:hypothetical protein